MPNEYSNFSAQDTSGPSGGFNAPNNPRRGDGDNGEIWNPTGGPNGTGAWEAPAPSAANPRRSFLLGAWGDRPNDLDANGGEIEGTSGAAMDEARYREMAQKYQPSTPQIDRSAQNESRTIGMGSLGLLQARANGAVTPAQELQAQQTAGAVNAVNSGAASIRGGAVARAAAARNAQATSARVQALGNQDQAALAARERAEAAGQLYTASAAQRGADLGLAGEQAKLEAQHRAAQDQHEAAYEGLNIDTKNANLSHLLGRTSSEQAAQVASNATSNAAETAHQANLERAQSGATGAIVGGLNAYGNSQNSGGGGGSAPAPAPQPYGGGQPAPAQQPYGGGDIIRTNPYGDEDPYSDPKAKTNIVPLYEDAGSGVERHWDADVAKGAPDVTTGASLSGPTPKYSSAKGAPMSSPKARVQERSRKLTDDELMRAARDMQANTEAQNSTLANGPSVRDRAPGLMTADEVYGDQRLALSDPKAKTEAFYMGMEHAANPEGAPMPDYVKEAPKTAQVTFGEPKRRPVTYSHRPRPSGDAVREKVSQPAFEQSYPMDPAKRTAADRAKVAGLKDYVDATEPGAPQVGDAGLQMALAGQREPMPAAAPPPAAPVRAPAYFGQPSQVSARITSDPKAKKDVGDSPMAGANRSMVPSVYEYRAEFTPPEQKPGEKNVGPMADKMEANPVAATAIVKDPQTGLLAIDKTKGLKLVMGGLADVQRQIDKMKAGQR